jgi:transcriptional regulator with PAS, ATPase and Fis domain
VLNCGAIPSELVESTLFGYRRGAFTGAHTDQLGVFEAAHGGTLFLDEVGELPLAAQVKLLRVLQGGTYSRVGESDERRVDVRIIAATHRDLTDAVREGRFREDLYYRLAVAVIRIPPLRERGRDLAQLIDALLAQIDAEHGQSEAGYVPKQLSAAARRLLLAHRWPGNVRELYNTLVRASIWAPGATIRAEDVELLPAVHEASSDVLGRPLGDGLDVRALVDEVKRHYLERALHEAGGNKTRAAALIGLPSQQTFSNWMDSAAVPYEMRPGEQRK